MLLKVYKYTSNRGIEKVGTSVASVPTIDFNRWVMQGNSLIHLNRLTPIEKLKTQKRLKNKLQ